MLKRFLVADVEPSANIDDPFEPTDLHYDDNSTDEDDDSKNLCLSQSLVNTWTIFFKTVNKIIPLNNR